MIDISVSNSAKQMIIFTGNVHDPEVVQLLVAQFDKVSIISEELFVFPPISTDQRIIVYRPSINFLRYINNHEGEEIIDIYETRDELMAHFT